MEADKPLEEIRQEEYSLPSEFEWDTLNIADALQVRYLLFCKRPEDLNQGRREVVRDLGQNLPRGPL